MKLSLKRREFICASGMAVAGAAMRPGWVAAAPSPIPLKRSFKQAIMWATIGIKGSVRDKMQAVRAAGFDGVEMTSHLDHGEVLKARDATGLEITSVCGERHWKLPLSHADPQVREEALRALQQTLRDAKAYGAGSILLVPGVVNQEVAFDRCWQRSIAQIQRALPLAEELQVKISIENVWNNFITTEDQAVRYLEEINSPWVGWHFDVGNVIRYGDPITWLQALGPRINRIHIKEYSRDQAMRSGDPWAGFRVPLRAGANNWTGIMKALDEIGYQGYLITEQGGGDTLAGLHELRDNLGKIIAA